MSDALIDEGLQKPLGFESISKSQKSRKDNEVNSSILSSLFLELVYLGIHFVNEKIPPQYASINPDES
ncbi:hypothetical protein [Virgibacillus pantothenticus]|nr:hypothetical protein [Virgibacillus pantothenticus]